MADEQGAFRRWAEKNGIDVPPKGGRPQTSESRRRESRRHRWLLVIASVMLPAALVAGNTWMAISAVGWVMVTVLSLRRLSKDDHRP